MLKLLRTLFSRHSVRKHLPPAPLEPYRVDISGTTFRFAIPENLSPNQPAEDLIAQVDLSAYTHLNQNRTIRLMRRWWDYYNGRPNPRRVIGTMMLSLDILPRYPGVTGSLFERQPLTESVYKKLLEYYQVGSASAATEKGILLPAAASRLFEQERYGAIWVSVGAGYVCSDDMPDKHAKDSNINLFACPLTEDWYLRAWFEYTSGHKLGTYFRRQAHADQVRIVQSFVMNYLDPPPTRAVVDVSLYGDSIPDHLDIRKSGGKVDP